MKNSWSDFQFQDMYVQHYINLNNNNNKNRINNTPGHNPSTEKIIRNFERKHGMNHWTKIIKKYSRELLENSCIMIDS